MANNRTILDPSEVIGMKFGRLTVKEQVFLYGPVADGETTFTIKGAGKLYNCQCECGKYIIRNFSRLNNNKHNSCGCGIDDANMKRTKNIAGQKFGEWTVIDWVSKPPFTTKKKKGAYWNCECSCGVKKILYGNNLRENKTKSCGHKRSEFIAERSRKYHPKYRSAKGVFESGYNDGDITIEQFLELSQMNCFYCNIVPNNKFNIFTHTGKKGIATKYSIENGDFIYNGLDRVNPDDLGHFYGRVVPCCAHCNTAKWDYSEDEFKNKISQIYHNYIIKEKSASLNWQSVMSNLETSHLED